MDQWTNGPMDQWTNAPMDQWTNGPMDQSILEFPEIEEFSTEERRTKAIPFRELAVNEVYKIQDYKRVNIGKRVAVILKLVDKEQTCVECWATKCVQEELEGKKDLWREQKLFIVSRGKKKSRNPLRDFYYDFKIIAKK